MPLLVGVKFFFGSRPYQATATRFARLVLVLTLLALGWPGLGLVRVLAAGVLSSNGGSRVATVKASCDPLPLRKRSVESKVLPTGGVRLLAFGAVVFGDGSHLLLQTQLIGLSFSLPSGDPITRVTKRGAYDYIVALPKAFSCIKARGVRW